MDHVSAPNCAVSFSSDAFSYDGKRVLGYVAAGKGFLGGFLQHSGVDTYYCVASKLEEFSSFTQIVSEVVGSDKPLRWIPSHRLDQVEQPGCLYVPNPHIAEAAWQRRFFGQRAYSICGVNHTICSTRVMETIGAMQIAPLQPWDALICTSRSSKAAIEHMLGQYGEYLRARLNAEPEVPIELPVIPLGVDCSAFDVGPRREEHRRTMRQRLGIGPEEIVVLYVGRLTYHAKAHPLPMYLALQAAAERTGKKLHLILAGWYPNHQFQTEFEEAAREWCPSVVVHFVDGRGPELPLVWHAADIFTSLPANIQETFGLTPIEAMAAGLPQVVSDWDGYRDTVRHGVDGLRIPTAMPEAGAGEELARRYYFEQDAYHIYTGHVGQAACVAVDRAADAFVTLIEQPEARYRMGQAAKHQAKRCFDWSVIVRAYQDLWRELAQRRKDAAEVAPGANGAPDHPLHEDPFAVFADYPTVKIDPNAVVCAVPEGNGCHLDQMRQLPMMSFSSQFLLDGEQSQRLLDDVQQPRRVGEMLEEYAEVDRDRVLRMLGWLAKGHLIDLEWPSDCRQAADAASSHSAISRSAM